MVKSRIRLAAPGLVALAFIFVVSFPTLRWRWERQRVVWDLALAWEPLREASTPPLCPAPQSLEALDVFSLASTVFQDATWLTHWGRALWLSGECRAAQRLWLIAAGQGDTSAWFELMITGAEASWPEDVAPALATYAAWKGAQAKKADLPLAAAWWYRRAWEIAPAPKFAQQYLPFLGDKAARQALWDATALRNAPDTAEHWWALAKSAELREEWGVAAVLYEQGASLAQAPYDYWMASGGAWQRIKAWNRAESAYRTAAQVYPASVEPWLNLGHLFRAQKAWDKAREAYLTAQGIKPDEFRIPYSRGIMAYEMGDDATAEAYLEEALALKPGYASTAYYLAQVTYRQGRVEDAESWMTRAVTWYAAYKPYGWALQLGDWRLELQKCILAREAYDLALDWGLKPETHAARLKVWELQCGGFE